MLIFPLMAMDKLLKNSLKYWFHLATAKYFIQNTNMPVYFEKRRGQKKYKLSMVHL